MRIENLPTLNASLNLLSAMLLAAGFFFIRTGRIRWHRACMLAAFTSSALFLTGYVIHKAFAGSTPFAGDGIARPLYFALLSTHTVLAIVIVPMVLVTLSRALRSRFDKHRVIARWTLPIWAYVSVTGVLVYLMLYVWFPGKEA